MKMTLGNLRAVVAATLVAGTCGGAACAEASTAVWTAHGSSAVDAAGHMFRTNYGDVNTFAAIDDATGKPRWTHQLVLNEDYDFHFQEACSLAGVVVVNDSHQLSALSLETGEVLWSNDFDGKFGPNAAMANVFCQPGQSSLYLSFGGETSQLFAIDLKSGQSQWTTQWSGSIQVQQVSDRKVIVYSTGNPDTLAALDIGSGKTLWVNHDQSVLDLLTDSHGNLFNRNQVTTPTAPAGVVRIDLATGKAAWNFPAGARGSSYRVAFDQVFVSNETGFHKLDPMTGTELWSEQDQGYLVALNKDRLFFSNLNPADLNQQIIGVVEAEHGRVLWSRSIGKSSYLLDTKSANLLLVNGREIDNLNLDTGTSLWTYTVAPADRDGADTGFVGFLTTTVGNHLYVNFDHQSNDRFRYELIGIDLRSGKQLLSFHGFEAQYRVLTERNGHVIVDTDSGESSTLAIGL